MAASETTCAIQTFFTNLPPYFKLITFLKKYSSLLFSILSGLLLFIAWPDSVLTPFIFIAFVPLLMLADKVEKKIIFFRYTFLSLLIWNIGTTWWIWNSTAPGAIGAIVANSLLMTVPLWGYHTFKYKYGDKAGALSFIVFWLSFEYIHLNWQLSWPWLTLGNVFATHPGWVQWYEYTGAAGGSLWVLLVNLLVYSVFTQWKTSAKLQLAASAFLLVAVPLVISFITHPDEKVMTNAAAPNVVIVQPNIDPYSEKFDIASTAGQIQKLIDLSEKKIDEVLIKRDERQLSDMLNKCQQILI